MNAAFTRGYNRIGRQDDLFDYRRQMTQILLNDDQTRLLLGGSAPIVIIDSTGRKVAEIDALSGSSVDVQSMTEEEWIAEGIRRAEEARRERYQGATTQEVLARLRALKPE